MVKLTRIIPSSHFSRELITLSNAGNMKLRGNFPRGQEIGKSVASMSIAVQPPYSPSIFIELNQQVPGSPYLGRPHNKAPTTKPAHSPAARVPEIGSPLLKRVLRGTALAYSGMSVIVLINSVGQKRPSSSPPPLNHKKQQVCEFQVPNCQNKDSVSSLSTL